MERNHAVELDRIMDDFRAFVKQRFEIADGDAAFGDDVHLFDYGYVDSFGAVDMTLYSEKKYGIHISNEDLVMNPLNTIREISTFIHRRVNQGA